MITVMFGNIALQLSHLRRLHWLKSLLRIVPCDVPTSRHLCSHRLDLKTMLSNQTDNYKGLHFDTTNADNLSTINLDHFEVLVQQQMDNSSSGKTAIRSLWFRISKANVHLIAPLIKLGFEFHHTKKDCIVLVKPLTQSSNIPKYAYTNIGVGALVVDNKMRVLVVKEKHFYVKQLWKFPGGYVEQGEELSAAVEREVLEETGVQAKFESMLVMRHMHRFAFDCSDMYFVSLLRPTSSEIRNCDQEIAQCQWAPIELMREQMSPFNRLVLDKFLQWKDSPLSIQPQAFEPYFASMPPYTLYSMEQSVSGSGENSDEI